MEQGLVGGVIVVQSEKVGQPARSGEIIEVRGKGDLVHYLVRWVNGHQSTYFPSGGAVSFTIPAAGPAGHRVGGRSPAGRS